MKEPLFFGTKFNFFSNNLLQSTRLQRVWKETDIFNSHSEKKKKRSDRKKGEEYDGWRWRWRRNRRGRKMVIKTRAHGRPRFEYRLSAGLKTIPGVLLFFHAPSRFLPRSSLPRTSNTCRGLLNSLRRHDST